MVKQMPENLLGWQKEPGTKIKVGPASVFRLQDTGPKIDASD